MSTLSPRPLPPTLLPSINTLLASLNLPFTIDNPTDLTPSLLLAIFESLINARLPITQTVRQSRTRDAQSRAMLVLLGVLECDVLRGGTDAEQSTVTDLASTSNSGMNMDDSVLGGAGGVSVDGWVDDIGLGDVDPEKLADGGWNETIFVGELLCWLARRKGVLPRIKSSNRSSQPRSLYSNHHSYGDEEGETADFSTSLLLRPSPAQRPRSIQQPRVPSPSLDDDDDEPDPDYSAFSHITDVPRHPLVHSPEPSLSISGTTGTDLSIRARSVSSRTSVSNPPDDIDEYDDVSHDTIQSYGGRRLIEDAEEDDDLPPTFHPRCIHELDDPSYIRALAGPSDLYSSASRADDGAFSFPQGGFGGEDDDEQENDPYAPPTPTPQRVRLTGWIDRVDANTELSQFAASRSRSLNTYSKPPPQTQSPSYSQFQSHKSRGWDTDIVSQSNQKSSSSSKSKSMFRTNVSSPPPNPISASRSRHISPSPPAPTRPTTSSSSSKPPKSTTPLSRPSYRSPSPLSDPDPDPDLDVDADQDAEPENSDNDAPFEISFSVNTSTPAKPRPPRRSQVQRSSAHPHHQSQSQSRSQSQGISQSRSQSQTKQRRELTGPGKGPGARSEYVASVGRRRSPSYTPSPPSFSAPGSGSLRSGLDGGGGGSGSGSLRGQRIESRVDTQYYPPPTSLSSRPTTSSSSAKRTNATATNASLGSGNGRSPPPGSTSRTSTLLTERARLLTELAALKRARAASGGGGAGAGSSASAGVAGMSHVGVGVR